MNLNIFDWFRPSHTDCIDPEQPPTKKEKVYSKWNANTVRVLNEKWKEPK